MVLPPRSMRSFIQITRHLYEEPHLLNLVIIASNGTAMGSLEFCVNTSDLEEIGNAFLKFTYRQASTYTYELGSEKPESKFAHYFRLKAFPTGKSLRSYAFQIHLNNNENIRESGWPHHHQMSDFCIETDIDELRKFGQLLLDFSELNQHRLYWSEEVSRIDSEMSNLSGWNTDVLANAFDALPK